MQRFAWVAIWCGLAASGVAGLVNQVVWQRALKVYLGGSETLSSMVVVLVFMLGLGLGSYAVGRVAHQLRHPLAALAGVELLLACVAAAVACALSLDVTETVYGVQRVAVGAGVPLRGVYAGGAMAMLLPPTVLMGATMPLASEAFQRQLNARDARVLPLLFFVNTLGAAAGALVTSLRLLPLLGQLSTLFVAVSANVLAALLIGAVAWGVGAVAPGRDPAVAAPVAGVRVEEGLGFALGALALAYEMVLFRLLSLAHEPLPGTFAVGLCLFLLAWSVGMAGAALVRHVPSIALGTSLVLGALPLLYGLDLAQGWTLASAGVVYALPALGFGLLYGALVERVAADWGRDVGRYAAFNTLGSCSGILLATFVLLAMPLGWAAAALALGVLAVGLVDLAAHERPRLPLAGLAGAAALSAVVTSVWGTSVRFTETDTYRSYWGRDGVVEVTTDGEVFIDGLWHTKLTDGVDHIGRPYSWLMATGALMAMERTPKRALVVGAGVGISSVTLEGYGGLEVVGYEINHTLQPVLRDYPDATLHATDRPRIRWIWQDARTGLALDDTRYDVILSAPLHLRQAGSSALLSTEYLRLLKSRLAPDGVVAVYSNEGSDVQTALIHRTVAAHFRHQVTWYDGVVTLASDRPIAVDAGTVRRFMERDDRLAKEVRRLDARLRREGWDEGVFSWYDGPVTGPWASEVISDDRPLVEYPELAEGRVGLLEALP